jgi:hypothetical protein
MDLWNAANDSLLTTLAIVCWCDLPLLPHAQTNVRPLPTKGDDREPATLSLATSRCSDQIQSVYPHLMVFRVSLHIHASFLVFHLPWSPLSQEVTEEDERALAMFMSVGAAPQRTLADIIMEKIQEKGTERGLVVDQAEDEEVGPRIPGLDPKVVEVYTGVGKLLSR